MFRYAPPKSSVWGHKLRKMAPTRQKELLDQFFAQAVAQNHFGSAVLMMRTVDFQGEPLLNAPTELIRRYELELSGGRSDSGGFFASLNEHQFNKCFDELLAANLLDNSRPECANLTKLVIIDKWRIQDREVPTKSTISPHFGPIPCISTFFEFETVEDFQFIQKVLADLGICKLNEKHLKPIKRKRSGPAE